MTNNREPIADRIDLESFKVIINSMEEGVVIQNSDNEIVAFNPATLKILGLAEDELLGRTSYDSRWHAVNEDLSICKPEDHPSVVAKRTLKPSAGRVIGVRLENQGIRWVRVTAVPVLHNSVLSHIVITFFDMTAEKEARSEIEEKKRNLRATIDAVPMSISYWNKDLKNISSNRTFLELYKTKRENAIGVHIRELIGAERYAHDQVFINEALAGKARRFERNWGSHFSALVSYVPDVLNGQVQGICLVETDVTELRDLEKERREVEIKLMHSARWAALGEMAGNIAHEINNPLTAIKIKISLLLNAFQERKTNSESMLAGLRSIEKIVDRIAKIVGALNYIARDGDEDEYQNCSIKKCVEDALQIARQRIELSGVRLDFVSDKDETIYCRRVQVSQAIMNLVANAFDAIQELEEKWIRISLKSDKNKVTISIVDSRKGVDENQRAQTAHPLFSTKSPGSGVGLGLSLLQDIIEKNGGVLFYDIEDGRNCFRIEFKKV